MRALGDERMREWLRRPEIRDRFTWQMIAELTVAEYEKIAPQRLVSP